ncbi:hypothetical protein V502_05869 [Pseudogymnoascus sp. VKM F-4520 (FW-2644)]|nr:hypothetical protein V502_05869 [Pseudogymnoascus sp. VKM F-4520 (FW-2644)]
MKKASMQMPPLCFGIVVTEVAELEGDDGGPYCYYTLLAVAHFSPPAPFPTSRVALVDSSPSSSQQPPVSPAASTILSSAQPAAPNPAERMRRRWKRNYPPKPTKQGRTSTPSLPLQP